MFRLNRSACLFEIVPCMSSDVLNQDSFPALRESVCIVAMVPTRSIVLIAKAAVEPPPTRRQWTTRMSFVWP